MKFFLTRNGSWVILGLAACAWVGVVFFIWTIENQKGDLAASQSSARSLEDRRASASKLQSLVRETTDSRARLDSIANVDVASMVDTIDAVGKDAGVYIQIGQASPDATKDSVVHSVTFQLTAEGSFVSIQRVAALLQTLPIPASLEQFQFNLADAGTPLGVWHMSARIRLLTTANISS